MPWQGFRCRMRCRPICSIVCPWSGTHIIVAVGRGWAVEEAMSRVDAFLNRLRNMAPMSLEGAGEDSLLDVQKHPWREPLEECHGCVLVYVYNARQLYDLTPLINQVWRPVVLLSEYDIPDETELPGICYGPCLSSFLIVGFLPTEISSAVSPCSSTMPILSASCCS